MKLLEKQWLGIKAQARRQLENPFKNNKLLFFMQAFTRNGGASYHS
ncbi:MAG: hypothetical protein ACO3EU_08405 [Arenimonas sp.]